MRAPKLVQHMKANADRMSEGLVQKIRDADRCRELLLRVPLPDHKQRALEIYRDLTDWLAGETTPVIEFRYSDLGIELANQGVPSAMCSGLCVLLESTSGNTCSRSASWKSRLNSGAA